MQNQKIAIVFPGQGSQSVGMLKEFFDAYPLVRSIYHAANEALGYDLWQLTQEGPEEKLNQTEYAQPALLAAGYAMWCVWQDKNDIKPAFLAGHSLGEYTALVAANALNFADALCLVRDRGRFMQEAVPKGMGGMAAIVGLLDDKIAEICKEAAQNEILSVANYNSIGQTVLAGQIGALNRAIELAKQSGAKLVKLLPVSVPSHSPLMEKAAEFLAERLKNVAINDPKIPVLHNFDVATHTDPESIRKVLIAQLISPVRWVETILRLHDEGVENVFECGPGKVLTGLNKRIQPSMTFGSCL